MKIQTFSILAGSEACNARCPFCISKMTPPVGGDLREPDVNWRNFGVACRLAERCGVTTAMLTGKGEPTLFPEQITRYLEALAAFQFPIVELQSNGILIFEQADTYVGYLCAWYDLGLTTVAISIVHHLSEKNRSVYVPHKEAYIDLPGLVDLLHSQGLSVRLACTLARGFIDSPRRLKDLVDFARAHKVEQLTVRPVKQPAHSRDADVFEWSTQHRLQPGQMDEICGFLHKEGSLLMTLVHGARVYDVSGQNVCLTDSLTIDAGSDDLRQLIFCPDGHLRYDWQYKGAILL
jgi:pyruvate-formate lyase-activating enzyme